jgi:hypothetical protein
MQKQIEFQIDWHPSGRRTLKERQPGTPWDDVMVQGLWGNDDPASFYQAVAIRMATNSRNGVQITNYENTSPSLAKQ